MFPLSYRRNGPKPHLMQLTDTIFFCGDFLGLSQNDPNLSVLQKLWVEHSTPCLGSGSPSSPRFTRWVRAQCTQNKKQCSRQLQCEVPCGIGDVVNSSLFINSSLSSLSSTSHAVHGGGGLPLAGGPASSGGILSLAGEGGVW